MTAAVYLFVEFCAVSGGLTDISEKQLYSFYLPERKKKTHVNTYKRHYVEEEKTCTQHCGISIISNSKAKSKTAIHKLTATPA